jgi:hypothetical protein
MAQFFGSRCNIDANTYSINLDLEVLRRSAEVKRRVVLTRRGDPTVERNRLSGENGIIAVGLANMSLTSKRDMKLRINDDAKSCNAGNEAQQEPGRLHV